MTTLVWFLVTIFVVVTVHEYGHYLAARFFRLRVLRFSVGFGSPMQIFGRKWCWTDKRGTEWVIAPIPLGGYVQILNLNKEDASLKRVAFLRSLESRRPWQHFVVYGAGPLANFILAAALYTALGMMGEQQIRPVVGEVRVESPAMNAGFQVGDEIAMVNNRPVDSWREVWAHFVDSVAEGEAISARTVTGVERQIPAGTLSLDDLAEGLHLGVGLSRDFSYLTSRIARVAEGSPAAQAGVAEGDVFVMINDAFVGDFQDITREVVKYPRQPVTLVIWRDGAEINTVARLGERKGGGGYLGVGPVVDEDKYAAVVRWVQHGAADAALLGIARVAEETVRVFKFLWLLVTGQLSAGHMSGPVGIATQAGAAAELGFESFLRFLAFISVNLGAINLFPLLLLVDGGESYIPGVVKSLFPARAEKILAWLRAISAAIIVGLMTFVIINDILKLL